MFYTYKTLGEALLAANSKGLVEVITNSESKYRLALYLDFTLTADGRFAGTFRKADLWTRDAEGITSPIVAVNLGDKKGFVPVIPD
jgi:hypothetical protein